MAGSDWMSGGKRRATNDMLHIFRDDLFVADSVLYGADCAVLVESAGNLRDRPTGGDGFSGHDAVIAARKFLRIARGVQPRSEIGGSRDSQTVLANSFDVICPDVIGPDFSLAFSSEVRGEEAADCATTDDANF